MQKTKNGESQSGLPRFLFSGNEMEAGEQRRAESSNLKNVKPAR
jgi:hypothetical protein